MNKIIVYKISDRLYRVRNFEKNTVKDCWVACGEILPPKTSYDTLSPTELQAVEIELF